MQMVNHPNRNRKTPPTGDIVTDFRKATAGDILDLGEGARYRYVLLKRAPEMQSGSWWAPGYRWMFAPQSFSTSALLIHIAREVSDAECEAHIARLTAQDLAVGIE